MGHTQEADKHPVCQKLLAYIGPGKKGAEIRDNFDAPPYGWPRDAIDGALYALLAAGHLKATDAASKPVDAKSLDRTKLTQAHFQRESINITPPQLIKIRQLFSAVGVPCQPKEEATKVPVLLAKLRDLAGKAGGTAPAPTSPALTAIEAVEAQTGNAQLLEIYNRADELSALAKLWTKTAADIAKRLPIWHSLAELLKHAKTLGPYAALKAEADAIESQRSLLAEPDPVRPLLDKVVDLLRLALNAKLEVYKTAFADQQAQLAKDADWNKLSDGQRTELGGQAPPGGRLLPCRWVRLTNCRMRSTTATSTTGCHAHRHCPAGSKLRVTLRCNCSSPMLCTPTHAQQRSGTQGLAG